MEDDALAHHSQELLDALNAALKNSEVRAALTDFEWIGLFAHREKIAGLLGYYRWFGSFTRRRLGGRAQETKLPTVTVSAPTVTVSAAGVGVETLGPLVLVSLAPAAAEVATAVVMVALPIVAAIAAVAALSAVFGGGSAKEVFGRKLKREAELVGFYLKQLSALTTLMAITVAEAATLSVEDLLKKIRAAATTSSEAALKILVAEFIKRFPQCYGALQAYTAAAARWRRLGANPGMVGTRWTTEELAKARQSMTDALKAMMACALAAAK